MQNLVEVNYQRTGRSTNTDELGMREMQARAYASRDAHHNFDLAVDRICRAKPFTSDEGRLEHLFKLYEEMTAKEKFI